MGTGLDITSELAGRTLSVEDIAGGFNTAQQLGLRTLASDTPLSVFNNGRGVSIVDARNDPTTGAYRAASAAISRSHSATASGSTLTCARRTWSIPPPCSHASTPSSPPRSAHRTTPVSPPSPPATLTPASRPAPTASRLFSPLAGNIKVETLNNSAAAEQLGMINLTLEPTTGEYIAQDRSGIRVNNLFTHLVELRDALLTNNTAGISLAGENMQAAHDRLFSAQSVVGRTQQTTR